MATQRYWPYGATRSGGVTQTDKLYTGQQEEPGDAALGLYNYRARFYSTVVGRFVSGDPIVGAAFDPQAWNPYTYVRSNPLRYVDPEGEFFDEPGDSTPLAQQGQFCGRDCRSHRAALQFIDAMTDPAKRQAFIDWVTPKPASLPVAGAGAAARSGARACCAIPYPNQDVDYEAALDDVLDGLDLLGETLRLGPTQAWEFFTGEGDDAGETPPVPWVGPKVAKQAEKRGWAPADIGEAINNPSETATVRDERHRPDGSRQDAPATRYHHRDGGYVVVNDLTGEVIQVSDRNDPAWKMPH